MTANRSLNAFLALILALVLAGLPALALAYGVTSFIAEQMGLDAPAMWGAKSLMLAWMLPGLIFTGLLVRPVENFIRNFGYGLERSEDMRGVSFDDDVSDTTSEAAEKALTEAIEKGLKEK